MVLVSLEGVSAHVNTHTYIHRRVQVHSIVRIHVVKQYASSSSRYISSLYPSLCQFLFHFFHCSLPDASHANGTVFAWSIIIFFLLLLFHPVFLHGLFIPFLLPRDYLDSSSRLISSRSYISPPRNFILCFLISVSGGKCI